MNHVYILCNKDYRLSIVVAPDDWTAAYLAHCAIEDVKGPDITIEDLKSGVPAVLFETPV